MAWVGDGNNMCNSYINASTLMGFELVIASPSGYETGLGGEWVRKTTSAKDAVEGADLVVTDVWASMGQEDEAEHRQSVFKPMISSSKSTKPKLSCTDLCVGSTI